MSYQALYRVWRPQTFDEMVGQTVIKETLKNAIKSNHISHAYLFTGPRGTGKTSAAKILAKAINCPNQVDGNPCNDCEMCQLITDGQLGDVVEIDAASNNGVDEIRDLRENVRYAASQAKFKVYIIDEVHMLTTAAFNALLKTLEEPPEQVVFILATTEAHKIPATILSRTQRFDFQLYTDQELMGRMAEILDHDNIDYEEEALAIIARSANGGMRDTVSLLDQAISFNHEEVVVETALEVSGSLNQLAFLKYIQNIYRQEVEEALSVLNEQLQKGKQAARFIDELILFCRDMLLTLHTHQNETLLSESEIQPLREGVPANFYYRLIDTLNDTQGKMRFSTQPDLYIEVMTIQLAQTESAPRVSGPSNGAGSTEAVDALAETVRQLEEKVAFLSQQLNGQNQLIEALKANPGAGLQPVNDEGGPKIELTPVEEPKIPRKRPVRSNVEYQLQLNKVHQVLNEATHTHIRIIKGAWQTILDELSPQQRAKFIETEPLAAGEGHVLISFPNPAYAGDVQQDAKLIKMIEKIIQDKANFSMEMVIVLSSEWASVRKNYAILRKKNNGQPIPIEEEEQVVEAVSQPSAETETVNSEPLAETNAVNEEENVLTDAHAEVEAVEEDTSLNDAPASNTVESPNDLNRTPSEESQPQSRPNFEDIAQDVQEEEGPPAIVTKAIEIFGEENIDIFYDK